MQFHVSRRGPRNRRSLRSGPTARGMTRRGNGSIGSGCWTDVCFITLAGAQACDSCVLMTTNGVARRVRWYPTSREKRARYPEFPARGPWTRLRVRNPPDCTGNRGYGTPDLVLTIQKASQSSSARLLARRKDRALMGLRPLLFGPCTLWRTWGSRPAGKVGL
jgi:hypothetical protein